MNRIRAFKYTLPAILMILGCFSFTHSGWIVWSPLVFSWILLPAAELLFPADTYNLNAAEEEAAQLDFVYDLLLYIFVVLQWGALILFLLSFSWFPVSSGWDIAGRIGSMGMLCGVFGINVGHELGHRVNWSEQTLAQAALLTSLYMHFFIEHNKGHHKNVATPQDPSSARYNEPVYLFYFRTISMAYASAWRIAQSDLKKQGLPFWSLNNQMLQFQIIQLFFLVALYFLFGKLILCYYLAAALIGILLLETVNYIEHYGLTRRSTAPGRYERAMPEHSWNSNHVLGRFLLFELSRHSDHHYLASRKYQLLRHHDHSPQLPTGYPGSMLLALIPPVWFRIMNQRIRQFQQHPDIQEK